MQAFKSRWDVCVPVASHYQFMNNLTYLTEYAVIGGDPKKKILQNFKNKMADAQSCEMKLSRVQLTLRVYKYSHLTTMYKSNKGYNSSDYIVTRWLPGSHSVYK